MIGEKINIWDKQNILTNKHSPITIEISVSNQWNQQHVDYCTDLNWFVFVQYTSLYVVEYVIQIENKICNLTKKKSSPNLKTLFIGTTNLPFKDSIYRLTSSTVRNTFITNWIKKIRIYYSPVTKREKKIQQKKIFKTEPHCLKSQ